ncbi:MAG: cell division protein ZapA [Gammaproteobacteria bacterium]|nr:MAG: cell division protein ZapA [Gammaproteobacteria bacterium]
MSGNIETVAVKILDKELLISCPRSEMDGLQEAASYLDSKMREIRNSGKVIGAERIAIMAALNIAHEMLQGQSLDSPKNSSLLERIIGLNNKIAEISEGAK